MGLYCLDTSAFVEAWVRLYPADTFPSVWARLQALCCDGTVISPDEVFREIARQEDELHAWLRQQNGLFYPMDEPLWREARSIMATFPRLVKEGKRKNQADPFVIALAKITGRIVVTEELGEGNDNKPNIPYICRNLQVPCTNVLGLFRHLQWNF